MGEESGKSPMKMILSVLLLIVVLGAISFGVYTYFIKEQEPAQLKSGSSASEGSSSGAESSINKLYSSSSYLAKDKDKETSKKDKKKEDDNKKEALKSELLGSNLVDRTMFGKEIPTN